jgi:hypothetical protein
MNKEPEKTRDSVTFIASGYEWTCPKCGKEHKEVEIYNEAFCDNCSTYFDVLEPVHVFH